MCVCVCEQLAQSRYVKRSGRDSNLQPIGSKSDALTTIRHHATRHWVEAYNSLDLCNELSKQEGYSVGGHVLVGGLGTWRPTVQFTADVTDW